MYIRSPDERVMVFTNVFFRTVVVMFMIVMIMMLDRIILITIMKSRN